MKKIFTFMIALVVSAGTLMGQDDSGYCGKEEGGGENIEWTFFESSSSISPSWLSLHGSGEMKDFTSSECPWKHLRGLIEKVYVDEEIDNIGSYAFYNCSELYEAQLYASSSWLEKIGQFAFNLCSKLTSIEIPNSVNEIGNGAFKDCSALTSVTLPTSLTTIKVNVFNGCSSLTTISIPARVTYIRDNAFLGCTGLTSITCKATTPPTCGTDCFGNVPKSIPVYVPYGTAEAYRNAYGWNSFTKIVEMEDPAAALEGVESIQPSVVNSQKILRNGQLFIEKNGELYNAQGVRVE